MSNTVIVVSEEFLKRIYVGLGELPAKFSKIVIDDIEAQVKLAEGEVHKYVALVEQHFAPFKDKAAEIDATAKGVADKIAADAAKVAAEVTTVAEAV